MRQTIRAIILAAAALLSASAANAQTATQNVNISASVPKYCRINGSATPADLTASIPVDSAGVVTTTAIPLTTVGTTVCNAAITLTAASVSGGVVTPTSAPSGFTNIINYTGSATFGSQTSDIDTSTTATASSTETDATPATTTGPATGSVSISITPQTPASPLVAATDYADTFRVTLTPN